MKSEHVKYVAALVVLTFFTYMHPGVQQAILGQPTAGHSSVAQAYSAVAITANVANVKDRAPVISSVTNPATVGQMVFINGQQINNTTLYIDGIKQVDSIFSKNNSNSKKTSFVLPLLTNGVHTLRLENFKKGTSDKFSFVVQGGIETATLKLSIDANSPIEGSTVIVNSGSTNDQADKVTFMVFDLAAEKDNIGITDIAGSVRTNAASSTIDKFVPSAYLYNGSTLLVAVAVASDGSFAFKNINGLGGYVISKDTVKSFTIKLDIRNIRNAYVDPVVVRGTIDSSGISAVDSRGVLLTGESVPTSVVSSTINFRIAAPLVTLLSKSAAKVIMTRNTTTGTSTSVFVSTYDLKIDAVGGDVSIGAFTALSPFVSGENTSTSSFAIFKNGVQTFDSNLNLTVMYGAPQGLVYNVATRSFLLPEGSSINIPVHVQFTVSGIASNNSYALQLNRINYNVGKVLNFPDSAIWRTDAIAMP